MGDDDRRTEEVRLPGEQRSEVSHNGHAHNGQPRNTLRAETSGGGASGGVERCLVRGLTDSQWRQLQKHFHLSPQQGLIVKLLLTQPWYECNHIDIAKLLNTGKSGIDKQVEKIFKRMDIHSRMHLSQVIDYEVVMRGWVRLEDKPSA